MVFMTISASATKDWAELAKEDWLCLGMPHLSTRKQTKTENSRCKHIQAGLTSGWQCQSNIDQIWENLFHKILFRNFHDHLTSACFKIQPSKMKRKKKKKGSYYKLLFSIRKSFHWQLLRSSLLIPVTKWT